MTYKEVAKRLGNADMEKVVMQVLHQNPCPILLPCHRVVGTNKLHGYVDGILKKKFLLELENKYKEL